MSTTAAYTCMDCARKEQSCPHTPPLFPVNTSSEPKAKNFFVGGVNLQKRKGHVARANYGDEILATGIFCECPVMEVTKHLANGGSHPDLLVHHLDECPAYEKIAQALKGKK